MAPTHTRIRRAFVTIDDRQVHYRHAGEGPVVIVIGQSPTSARMLDKQTAAFAEAGFTAIALDAPGLGRSTPHNTPRPDVSDQAIGLARMLDALGVDKVGLYGSHSGASIALEFSRLYPDRSAIALMDGLPIYNDLERNLRLSTYFPEYETTWDGLHLMWLWYRYREQNVFWPWNIRGRGARGPVDIPSPRKLHDGVVDILEVGNGYIPPYAAVFRYRAEDAIPHLSTPAHFLAYPDDSLLPALRHLPNLPDCCHLTEMPLDKTKGIEKEIELLRSVPAWGASGIRHGAAPRRNGSALDYVDVAGGQLAVARWGIGKGRPLVILPPAPGSVTQLGTLPEYLGEEREAIAIDLPGCGDSDVLEGTPVTVEAFAEQVATALDQLAEGPVDIYARDGAAAVALDLRRQAPDRVRRLLIDNVPAVAPTERDEIAEAYAEPITLDWDGAHLVRLWHATRDKELYWPWYNRTIDGVRYENDPQIDPHQLTVEVNAYLKNFESYAPTWKAILQYPVYEALAEPSDDIVVCADEDGRYAHLARAVAGDRFRDMPLGVLARSGKILKLLD